MIMRTHTEDGRSVPVALVVMVATLTVLAGCATQRDPSAELQSARSAYQAIEQDPEAARSAAEALDRAERELDLAAKLLADGEDMALVNHHAYLAERYTRIAENQVQQAKLRDQIDEARNRRQELRIEMERRKAQRARAEQAELAAERAELRAQLSDLQARQTERGMVLTLGDVLFAFDKAELKPGGERAARRLADFLREYPERRIRVEGHTDSVGPASYNQELSRERAMAVKQAIVGHGIAPSRIVVEGYGEQYPVASNDNEAGRQRNRRVEILISDQQGRLEERS